MIKYICSSHTPPPYPHPWWKYGAGFYSNYLRILQQLAVMDKTIDKNILVVPYIDWSISLFVDYNGVVEGSPYPSNPENPWYKWFKSYDYSNCNKEVYANSAYDPDVLNQNGSYWKDNNEQVKYFRNLDKKYNILHDHIIEKINDFNNLHFKNNRVLCVMARASEYRYNHNSKGFWELEHYIEKARTYCKDFDKVFLVTDDSNWIEPFCSEVPNTVYCNVFRRTDQTEEYIKKNPYWWADTVRPDHAIRLGEECLIQGHLMAKCHMIIGRQCGTVNGAMLFNESIEKYDIVGFE